ncbi:MAG: triose-phosphate isomerase [Gemmatimonadota bacterium]
MIFAANWKMHLAPDEARSYAHRFLDGFSPRAGSHYWFFPPAVSLEATALAFRGLPEIRVGAQDVYWEPKGAFTGATSVPLAAGAGAAIALVGHSERRHVFGETDLDTARKVRALLAGSMTPLLCVGEKLEERESGATEAVVLRQVGAVADGLDPAALDQIVIAYEPVWAIGTGKNATPQDAAAVHRTIRRDLRSRGAKSPRILYGGSVNLANADTLLAEEEINGVLVGGASLDPDGWRRLIELGSRK